MCAIAICRWRAVVATESLGDARVYTFVFTKIFKNSSPHWTVFLLCGIVPFNFFALAWQSATTSLVDNAGLIKRVAVPRKIIPITSAFSNCPHLRDSIALLLVIVFATGVRLNIYWLFLPLIWGLELTTICGMGFCFPH